MSKKRTAFYIFLFCATAVQVYGQKTQHNTNAAPATLVNVFLGTSGDHGQLSPGASSPFSFTSVVPQTYPHIHTGYEYAAKNYLGFAHTCLEGVGCMGSGGDLLITPYVGSVGSSLVKKAQSGGAGWYKVAFENGLQVSLTVFKNTAKETYVFPKGKKGFSFDLSHTLANGFVDEQHTIGADNTLSGWIDARTTCGAGVFRLYYYIVPDRTLIWKEFAEHKVAAQRMDEQAQTIRLNIGFSSTGVEYAKQNALTDAYANILSESNKSWNGYLSHLTSEGPEDRQKLFYSLLYRVLQSPYLVSEKDGAFKGADGHIYHSDTAMYSGWSVWDNYKTQLPLLSLFYPKEYQGIIRSLTMLYKFGKKDYATKHEPTNTVRTEHTIVVLLDAYRKGYAVDFNAIFEELRKEVDALDFGTPDKKLEFSYDTWAFAEICKILGKNDLYQQYLEKAKNYKDYWQKDFADIHKHDVDRMQARGLYQGTIWQYRWFVPFDMKGLIALDGGDSAFTQQLNYFFNNDLYNHANEPDIQVPSIFNATSEPWRAQELMHKYAVDTVVQYYFNDNSRGIDPFVDRIYKNEPKAYIRTMDDDAGANSAWFVLAACGLYPACVGYPVYYLSVPLLPEIDAHFPNGKQMKIKVHNFSDKNMYIQKVLLNGKSIDRTYVTHQEITDGGTLDIYAGDKPNKYLGQNDKWISSL